MGSLQVVSLLLADNLIHHPHEAGGVWENRQETDSGKYRSYFCAVPEIHLTTTADQQGYPTDEEITAKLKENIGDPRLDFPEQNITL